LQNISNNYDAKTLDEQTYPLIPEACAHVWPLLCPLSAHIALQEDYYAAPNDTLVDPYYFPSRPPNQPTKTPELKSSSSRHSPSSSAAGISDPTTPGRDPAAIDRRALVGVGELATPRWTTKHEYVSRKDWEGKGAGVEEVQEELEPEPEPVEDVEDDVDRCSPWTIEAVDDNDTSEQKNYVSLVSPCWSFRVPP
jgi:dual specificity tyrosine-phosphorylation-regulated kinase 2/3/4